MSAAELVAAEWLRFAPVDLAELNGAAALAHRVDTKYLVRATLLADVLDQLRPTHACLDIDGQRSFPYRSRYVDSPELGCYHDHRRGVRRRWKARTRTYLDSGVTRWEVKLKDGRGMTIKRALPLPDHADDQGRLAPEMRRFLTDVLDEDYGLPAPADLRTTLTVGYRRSTLTERGEENRITVDTALQMTAGDGQAHLRPDLVLVETKSPAGRSAADRALRAAGVRPASVSKYCAGLALLHPALPDHPWRRLLRHHFVTTPVLSHRGQELAA